MAASSSSPLEVSLSDPLVLAKYDQAAAVCNVTMASLIQVSIAGANIFQICEFGDNALTSNLKQVFPDQPTLTRGIAFPTCVSVNNVVSNFSPATAADKSALKVGDVVKIELGAHIDGVMAVTAHTFVVRTAAPEEGPTTGPAADAICAVHFATEAALRLMRPGKKASQVVSVIEKIAAIYGCHAVVESWSHQVDRYAIEGKRKFGPTKEDPRRREKEDFEFDVGEAYTLNVVVSTGEGKPREGSEKATVFRRDSLAQYQLKMAAARKTMGDIKKFHPTLPFHVRSLKDQKQAKLGMTEIIKHQLLIPYPVLIEKADKVVAQFKNTVLILPQLGETRPRTAKLTAHPLPFVSSSLSITDAEILELISGDLSF